MVRYASSMMRCRLALPCLLTCLGCGFFDNWPTSDGGSAGGQGYGKPTLEVTVGGVHFGPATPGGGSAASLVNTRDEQTGRIVDSVFRVAASAPSVGATCSLNAQRFGDGVAPIRQGSFQFMDNGGRQDGTIVPVEGESVVIPEGSWMCTGAECGSLVLLTLDETHVEGYLSGAFQRASDGSWASVVCSFYLPWGTYSP